MADKIYHELRKVLDTIPNGFPKTESGLEIDILKKIYSEEEASLTTKLKLNFETADAIAERTGLDKEYLAKKLKEMGDNGQIFGGPIGGTGLYKLMPFVFGIYEYQLYRMDRELASMINEYMDTAFGKDFHGNKPSLMKVLPIEEEIPHGSVIEPYESLTKVIESGMAWAVADCVCRKEKHLLDKGCDNPLEVCLGIAPVENFFDTFFWGKSITKEEALANLNMTEEAGLVHMTSNVKSGHIYICSCCGCCCGMLRGINEIGNPEAVAHSNYLAVVDESLCTSCEICEERCQVNAIEINNFAEIKEGCIGCGLCVTTCPQEAIKLVQRDESDFLSVPEDEKDWLEQRGKSSGRNDYKKLL